MTASAILRATVLGVTALAATAGCGAGGHTPAGARISGAAFDSNPCGAYSLQTLAAVAQPALTRAGWPKVGPAGSAARPDVRYSAQVQRCRYPLAVADAERDGEQAIIITVYDEMSNGRALMDACEARGEAGAPSPGPVSRPIGDESCLDAGDQWRFRVADRYVSVSVDVPRRVRVNGDVVAPSGTTTYVAPDDPRTRADVGRAVAQDVALRLR